MKRICIVLAAALVLTAALGFAQGKKKEDPTRSLQGVVTQDSGEAVVGAQVYLKNTKNLAVRSYITQDKGSYVFHGLSPDVDYEVNATFGGASSPTKKLSSFDSKKDAVINLTLAKK